MPPPSFSSSSTLSTVSVPRTTLNAIKDVVQHVQAAAAKHDGVSLTTALQSIDSLLQDPALELRPQETDLLSSLDRTEPASQVVLAVADRLNTELLDVVGAVNDTSRVVLLTFVAMLEPLAMLLGPKLLVRDWWEPVLYPTLKLEDFSDADASRIRTLTVYMMMAAPDSAYSNETHQALDDEQEPVSDAYFSFTQYIFELYVQATEALADFAPLPEDYAALRSEDAENDPIAEEDLSALVASHACDTPEGKASRRALEIILSVYSLQRPGRFFHHLAHGFAKGDAPTPLLYLLVSFLHHHTMHLYRMTSTNLVLQIMQTLLVTQSTRTMSLGVACIIMILPHIVLWMIGGGGGGVRMLFRVYGRTVSWHRPAHAVAHGLTPNVDLLFTLIYGIFPCNLLRFLRGPKRYLEEMDYSDQFDPAWKETLDEEMVRTRSQAMLRTHATNPTLVDGDAASELTNTKRFAHVDASDITAECMSLRIELNERPKPDADALLREHANNRQALPRDALKDAEHKFELYLKDQLLLHIGRLHRDRIANAVSEAEQQNLYHTLRTLRSQLYAAEERVDKQRAEMQTTSMRHVQWERELNSKLNNYREERRAWIADIVRLKQELEVSKTTIQIQHQRITDMGTHTFELEKDLQRAEPKLAQLEAYGENVRKMSNCLSDLEEDLTKYDIQGREMDKLLSWWQEMELVVSNSEANAGRYRRLLEERTTENTLLKSQLEAMRADAKAHVARREANRDWLLGGCDKETAETHDQYKAQNATLELLVMELRARIEELETDLQYMRKESRELELLETDSPNTGLFSPETLGITGSPPPPLSLGSPLQKEARSGEM
ncbi:hypothetical protein MVES1_002636 [Malassezia vespertilionis]|uniref:Uncharacterized protein n=1 Tax=Malassezia vespertilionis TaxID=2020962 RepID=A0A2N1JAX6_9BASI|nr:uncharacterized protein MVES1_002636 [Malassezia vespertilionis]PKI83706.1 hypothetical protein MVES_002489 [Malassezia vespertilionis]WFD07276.1 hypothetical protein MVES1_002636 [Malassezia vespertilionis]